MKKAFLAALLGITVIFVLFNRKNVSPQQIFINPSPTVSRQTAHAVTVFAKELEVPWALVLLPNKDLLVTERPGRVRLITDEGRVREEPIARLKTATAANGEGGLMGITLHPQFSKNKFVYLYYTYQTNGNQTKNRVVRMTLTENKLTNEEIIVDNIPGALFHDGGRIKFGPDKFLYITTGDAGNPLLAQNTDSLAGKILRVTDEGNPAPGNPFTNLVYSYGHRNPQGIAWCSDGSLWATEHGRSNPTGFDEINLIEPGKNYGWDSIQGDQTKNGLQTPKRNSGATTTWAPSGATCIGNAFYFAGLRGQTLYKAVIQNSEVTTLQEYLGKQYGRFRDVVADDEGMLYITTSNRDGRGIPEAEDDRILKINPKLL